MTLTDVHVKYLERVEMVVSEYQPFLEHKYGLKIGDVSVIEMPVNERKGHLMGAEGRTLTVNIDRKVNSYSLPVVVAHELGHILAGRINPFSGFGQIFFGYSDEEMLIHQYLSEGFAHFIALDYCLDFYKGKSLDLAQRWGMVEIEDAKERIIAGFTIDQTFSSKKSFRMIYSQGYAFMHEISSNNESEPFNIIKRPDITAEDIWHPEVYLQRRSMEQTYAI